MSKVSKRLERRYIQLLKDDENFFTLVKLYIEGDELERGAVATMMPSVIWMAKEVRRKTTEQIYQSTKGDQHDDDRD